MKVTVQTLDTGDSGDIRTVYSVMLEPLVERLDAHRLHPLADQVANGIVDHGGGDAG